MSQANDTPWTAEEAELFGDEFEPSDLPVSSSIPVHPDEFGGEDFPSSDPIPDSDETTSPGEAVPAPGGATLGRDWQIGAWYATPYGLGKLLSVNFATLAVALVDGQRAEVPFDKVGAEMAKPDDKAPEPVAAPPPAKPTRERKPRAPKAQEPVALTPGERAEARELAAKRAAPTPAEVKVAELVHASHERLGLPPHPETEATLAAAKAPPAPKAEPKAKPAPEPKPEAKPEPLPGLVLKVGMIQITQFGAFVHGVVGLDDTPFSIPVSSEVARSLIPGQNYAFPAPHDL